MDQETHSEGFPNGKILNNKFVITSYLGGGAMGLVYLAHDRANVRRKVVIKTLKEKATKDEYVVKHFRQEAEALERMNHDGIVRFVERSKDLDSKREFLVMEYAEGAPLSELISRGPMDKKRCVEIVNQIAFALRHAHEKDVYHRDLKPDNIIVNETKDGEPDRVKLIDFGLAKVRVSTVGTSTDVQVFAGTWEYASPEQLDGKMSIEGEAFCLAIVAYHMLTQQQPFRLTGEEPPTKQLRALHKRGAISPSRIREDVQSNIDAVFKKAFEVDPENRYQTPYEFARAFSGAFGAPNHIRHQPVVYPRTPFVRRRVTKLLLGLTALLGIGALCYWLLWT